MPAGGAGGPALGAYVMHAARRAGRARRAAPRGAVSLHQRGLVLRDGAVRHADGGRAAAERRVAAVAARFPPWRPPRSSRWRSSTRACPSPVERAGGRISGSIWRVRRFVHDGVRTTYHLLRHGDRFLAVGAITYFACDVASLACAFQAFGGGAPPVGDFVLAYTLGHAGAFLPTPGGIGGVEGGLIGMFVDLRRAAQRRRRRGARLPRLPARAAGDRRRGLPAPRPPRARPPAAARGGRGPLRGLSGDAPRGPSPLIGTVPVRLRGGPDVR